MAHIVELADKLIEELKRLCVTKYSITPSGQFQILHLKCSVADEEFERRDCTREQVELLLFNLSRLEPDDDDMWLCNVLTYGFVHDLWNPPK